MKHLHIIFGLLLLLVSCNTNIATVSYAYRNLLVCTMNIPKGYEEWTIMSGCEREQQYSYSDSSFFYISSRRCNANMDNIERLGDSVFNIRFQDKEVCIELNELLGKEICPILPDTFELSGKNSDSLYWRDIVIGDISLGYVNVHSCDKKRYDCCLDSYMIKKRTATYVEGRGYKGYAFSKEYPIAGLPPEKARYTLNQKEISKAEYLLRKKINEYVETYHVYTDLPINKKALREYIRQYVGYLTENNEVVIKIYLNKIGYDDDPSSDILEYYDGGSDHWSIIINLNTEELFNMIVNGRLSKWKTDTTL